MDEGTLQWRMKLRWPHFWHQVERHPVLGTGTYVDMRLGTSANTPHNGYLAIAVESGLPALGLYLLLVVLAIGRSLGRLRRGANVAAGAGDDGALDALAVAALVGLMVHNFDDTVWPIPAIAKVLWLLVALALAPPRSAPAAAAASEAATAPEATARAASAAPAGRVAAPAGGA
jgi:O-antigen ligase